MAYAIKESANVINRVAQQHEDHGKKDMEQLLNWLYTYKGLLSNVPDILSVHRVFETSDLTYFSRLVRSSQTEGQ